MAFSGQSFPALQFGTKFRGTKIGVQWPVAVTANSGFEYRALRWGYPRLSWSIPARALTWQDKETLLGFWNQMGGSLQSFLYTDPEHNTLNGGSFTASATPTGTGNGVQASFNLLAPNGQLAFTASVTAIHRTDWQGRQLLYPTARTSIIGYSQTATGWGSTNGTAGNDAATGPDGGSAVSFTEDTTDNYRQIVSDISTTNKGPNLTSYAIIDIKLLVAADGIRNLLKCYFSGSTNHNFQINIATGAVVSTSGPCTCVAQGAVGNGYYRYIASITWDSTEPVGTVPLVLGPNYFNSYTGTGTKIWNLRVDFRDSTPVGGYIANDTGASLSVTDYTLTGTTVNLAQSPVSAATLDWDGSGTIAGVSFGAGTQIASPAAPTLAAASGTLAAATYTYAVTAYNALGETLASATASITLSATGGAAAAWAAVSGAAGYRVYGRVAGALGLLADVGNVLTYTDSGSAAVGVASPSVNGTGTLQYPCIIPIAGVNHPLFHVDGFTIEPNNFTLEIINGQPTLVYPAGSAPLYGTLVNGSGTYVLAARFDSSAGYALQNAVFPEQSAVSMDAIKLIEVFE